MKAERRHELQENSLIRNVRNFPQFWKDYGSKISLVIILFLLTLVLVRYWLTSRETKQREIGTQLTSARVIFEQYRRGEAGPAVLDEDPRTQQFLTLAAQQFGDASIPILFLGEDADARIRTRVRDHVENAVAETLKNSSDTTRQAEAKLLRADLNLYFGLLATAESTAAPSTQPTTRQFEKTPEQYFDIAKSNYEELIAAAGQIPARLATAARFGLGAVHENRGNLSEARTLYETIFNNGPDAVSKKLAGARIDMLARMPANPLLGPPMTPKPETQPATTQASTTQAAATEPSTAPATQPTTDSSTATTGPVSPATTQAAPATVPATKPAND